MKYFVTVNGSPHEVELVERLATLCVRFDGADIDARYEEVDRLGQVALFLGEKSYAVSIQGDAERSTVSVAGHQYEVELEDERERAAHAAERSQRGGGGEVKSVMPGIVAKLLVKPGDLVTKGQALLILEAMKMQNEIGAPSDARIKSVHIVEGQAVSGGAKLITLTPHE